MKFFARLHAIVAFVILGTLYIAWNLRSFHPIIRGKKAWNHSSIEIVVFGDSWSTNSLQPNDAGQVAQEQETRSKLDALDGQTWVDILCAELVCDRVENHAQSYPRGPEQSWGPVVNNAIYGNVTRNLDLTLRPSAISDLEAQVSDYLAARAESGAGGETISNSNVPTSMLFTIFFGIWDIWAFVLLDESEARHAIAESVGSLYAQVDRLLRAKLPSSVHVTMLVPKIPDPTFLPRWFDERTGPTGSDKFGQLQRRAVVLANEWNELLEMGAETYTEVDILLPDFHQWMMDQMRAPERHATAFPAQLAGPKPAFTELRQPCINYTASSHDGHTDDTSPVVCPDPSRHLFWDSVRLTSAASTLLGKFVVQRLEDSSSSSSSSSSSTAPSSPTSTALM